MPSPLYFLFDLHLLLYTFPFVFIPSPFVVTVADTVWWSSVIHTPSYRICNFGCSLGTGEIMQGIWRLPYTQPTPVQSLAPYMVLWALPVVILTQRPRKTLSATRFGPKTKIRCSPGLLMLVCSVVSFVFLRLPDIHHWPQGSVLLVEAHRLWLWCSHTYWPDVTYTWLQYGQNTLVASTATC